MMAGRGVARSKAWAALALIATLVLSWAWCLSVDAARAAADAEAAQGRLTQQQSRLETARSHAAQSGWDEGVQDQAEDAVSKWAGGSLAWSAPTTRRVPAGCEAMAAPDAATVTSVDVVPCEAGSWLAIVGRSDGTWAVGVTLADDGSVSVTSCTRIAKE